MSKEIIIYRGPLERARLKLLVDSIVSRKNNKVTFVWIYPRVLDTDKKKHFEDFITRFKLENVFIFYDKGFRTFQVKNQLKKKFGGNFEMAHFIGFKSYFFADCIKANKKIWYVNGVPEESTLQANNLSSSIKCFLNWSSVKYLKKPDLIVTVSKPMQKHVKKKTYNTDYFVVPITVDSSVFKNTNPNKNYLTYLGSGASWQALDLLEKLWYEISQIDESVLFRVISRDKRCEVLGSRIPAERINFCSSSEFSEVAEFLSETKMGFLIRRNHIVNNVAFPTKYAEYVASGAFVALSEIEWDLNDYVKKYNTGILVNPKADLKDTAREIVLFLEKNYNAENEVNFERSTEALSNSYWNVKLNERLNAL